MLFARQASGAVLANNRTASQAERAKNSGSEAFGLILEPVPDIGGRFGLVGSHVLRVPYYTGTCQEKNEKMKRKNAPTPDFTRHSGVSRQKLARPIFVSTSDR